MKVIVRTSYIIQHVLIALVSLSLMCYIIYYSFRYELEYSNMAFWLCLIFVFFLGVVFIITIYYSGKKIRLTGSEIIEENIFGKVIKKHMYSEIVSQNLKKNYSSIRGVRISNGYNSVTYFFEKGDGIIISQNQYENYLELKNFIQMKIKDGKRVVVK